MKRYTNPLMLLGILLFATVLGFVQIQSVEAQAGVPWTALFYSNNDFTGNSQLVSYTNGLSQNWGAGPPTDPNNNGLVVPGIPANNFSARFSSNTTIIGGLYEFIVVADGGVRLTVNGQSLIDDIGNTGPKTYSAIANLATGAYLLVLDYVDYSGDALIQVNWLITDGTPTAGSGIAPTAQGEVVQVRGLSLRNGPFLGATMLRVARPGVIYPVLARNTQEGLFTWYLIQYDPETQGWVSGRYFAITEGIAENLPVINVDEYTTAYDPPGLVTGVARSNMNFRAFPTERALRIAEVPQLPWGAYVEILARTRQGGFDFWYMVRYTVPDTSNSYVGWIYAPFVDIVPGSDPIDTIPRL